MVGKLTPDDGTLSASKIPALLGLSPYKTPNELLKEAIDAANGIPPSRLSQSEQMRLGDLLEPTILREAAYRLDLDHVNVDITEAIHHPDLPLAAGRRGGHTRAGRAGGQEHQRVAGERASAAPWPVAATGADDVLRRIVGRCVRPVSRVRTSDLPVPARPGHAGADRGCGPRLRASQA
jgi:hypothetical protein